MSVWSWLKLTVCLWLLRKAVKVTGWLLLAALAALAWPVTLIAAAGYAAAWLRGWPPVRLYRAAAWALPVTMAWLAAAALHAPGWPAALAPGRAWPGGWDHLAAPNLARTFLLTAPAAVPAGLAVAGIIWAWRIYAISAGLGGIMASAPITFDARQWKRQVRTAKGVTEAPGAVPLRARGGKIPVGGTIRAIGHRWHPVFTLPATACARHMVVVGATGSGKTNLMIRLWAGWFTATLAAARAGRGNRPLLVVLDGKGGRDARVKAGRTRRLLYGAGARRVAIWPDEARLSLWDLPAADLYVFSSPGRIGKPKGNARRFLRKAILEPGTRFAILTTQGAPKPDKKTGELPTQEEQDRWERVIPIMNELLAAKGLTNVAEGAVLVTGIKGPLEEGWQNKVTAFADQIMATVSNQPG